MGHEHLRAPRAKVSHSAAQGDADLAVSGLQERGLVEFRVVGVAARDGGDLVQKLQCRLAEPTVGLHAEGDEVVAMGVRGGVEGAFVLVALGSSSTGLLRGLPDAAGCARVDDRAVQGYGSMGVDIGEDVGAAPSAVCALRGVRAGEVTHVGLEGGRDGCTSEGTAEGRIEEGVRPPAVCVRAQEGVVGADVGIATAPGHRSGCPRPTQIEPVTDCHSGRVPVHAKMLVGRQDFQPHAGDAPFAAEQACDVAAAVIRANIERNVQRPAAQRRLGLREKRLRALGKTRSMVAGVRSRCSRSHSGRSDPLVALSSSVAPAS